MMAGWTDWLALALAVAFTLGCVAVSCCMIADDLTAPPDPDDWWHDGTDWIGPT